MTETSADSAGCEVAGASTTYCFGLSVAALVLFGSSIRNLASNVALPDDDDDLRGRGAHRLLAGLDPGRGRLAAARPCRRAGAVALVLGAVWISLAWRRFHAFVSRGRRAGSFDFGE